ncbi:hydrolase [Patulibacter medicamentivorans]|uniref:Hydrolase n=1 Tax=Patulibacter medicamentivorans TaxID=1097667 RepID=H0EBY3_9ACTN|nr:alpha/beta hydrolase [Patulibacter medicamentivorans]EHN08824.1 hydrolase [Patulibacter medicamentivorans]
MLAHDQSGDGAPLVLLHFLGGDRNVWRSLLPRLTAERRVITVDLPGFGDSRSLPGSPTLGRLTDTIEEFVGELGLERPAVAGISVGGGIAVELAARDAVSSAVAINPVGFASRAEAAFAKASMRATHAACKAIAGQADRLTSPKPLRTALGAQMFAKPWAVPAEDLAGLVRGVAHSPGTIPVMRATFGAEIRGGATSTPLTIAWGQRDALLLPRQGPRAIERLPFARLAPLPGCGHVPLWDDPERVTAAILDGTAAG